MDVQDFSAEEPEEITEAADAVISILKLHVKFLKILDIL
jgi:hypothetical protein